MNAIQDKFTLIDDFMFEQEDSKKEVGCIHKIADSLVELVMYQIEN